MITGAYLMPHPPIIVPGVGMGREEDAAQTITGIRTAAQHLASTKPETIVLITPHGPSFTDAMAIYADATLRGDLAAFNHPEHRYERENDIDLLDELIFTCLEKNLPAVRIDVSLIKRFNISRHLEHGALVPLHFIDEVYTDYQLLCISYGFLTAEELYRFGMAIAEASEHVDRRIAVIASGDLSHRLKAEGPYDYHPDGAIFDQTFLGHLKSGRFADAIGMDQTLCKNAGECGKRSVDVLLGTLDGFDASVVQHSYEGPFGVGYGVVSFQNLKKSPAAHRLEKIIADKATRMKTQREKEDAYVRLAREAVEAYVRNHKRIDVPDLAPEPMKKERAGAFVSIKSGGGLRGCMGTIAGTEINIGEEIISNAIKAATGDPRFPEIEEQELMDLTITVDILGKAEPVQTIDQLDPQNYGVIVTKDYRRGLLLPNLDGIDTVREQVTIALNKAGIDETEDYTIERFKVVRHY